MGDEGLDRITYYSVKREVLGKSAEQVAANTVANPTLSETVALLIERWDGLDEGVKAEIADLLSHDEPLTPRARRHAGSERRRLVVFRGVVIRTM